MGCIFLFMPKLNAVAYEVCVFDIVACSAFNSPGHKTPSTPPTTEPRADSQTFFLGLFFFWGGGAQHNLLTLALVTLLSKHAPADEDTNRSFRYTATQTTWRQTCRRTCPPPTFSPYELFAVKAEGGLAQERWHELVPVDLVDLAPHGALPLSGKLFVGFLLHRGFVWQKKITRKPQEPISEQKKTVSAWVKTFMSIIPIYGEQGCKACIFAQTSLQQYKWSSIQAITKTFPGESGVSPLCFHYVGQCRNGNSL